MQQMWVQHSENVVAHLYNNNMREAKDRWKRYGTRLEANVAGRMAIRSTWFSKLVEKGHDIKKTKLEKSIDEEPVHCRRCLRSMP